MTGECWWFKWSKLQYTNHSSEFIIKFSISTLNYRCTFSYWDANKQLKSHKEAQVSYAQWCWNEVRWCHMYCTIKACCLSREEYTGNRKSLQAYHLCNRISLLWYVIYDEWYKICDIMINGMWYMINDIWYETWYMIPPNIEPREMIY